MKFTCLTLLILTQSAACAAISSECPRGKIVFSCATMNAKTALVCDAGETIDYTFGKHDQAPELSLQVPRTEAATTPWNGFGAISYSIELPNASTVYRIYWSAIRDPEHPSPIRAGISISSKGKEIGQIRCDTSKPLVNEMEDIDLPPAR